MPALIARGVLPVAAALVALTPKALPDRDALFVAVNAMRVDPPAYGASLAVLEGLFKTPDALTYHIKGEAFDRVTREGVVAVKQARATLAGQAPLAALQPSPILRDAARDHAVEQADGTMGHISPDGATPGERVKRRGGGIYVAEVLNYGATDAADVLRQLIIDDGVPRRGHRTALLSGTYRYAGIWCGPHATLRSVCVIDLAQTPDGSAPPDAD